MSSSEVITPAAFRARMRGLFDELAASDVGLVITGAVDWVAEQLALERGPEEHEGDPGMEVDGGAGGRTHRDSGVGPDS